MQSRTKGTVEHESNIPGLFRQSVRQIHPIRGERVD